MYHNDVIAPVYVCTDVIEVCVFIVVVLVAFATRTPLLDEVLSLKKSVIVVVENVHVLAMFDGDVH